ncbi:MAG: glycosyltransferase family 4 protein [Polyangiaceae bacterium]
MRVLITTQVYPPEIHPTAVMVHELARHLVAIGWEVTVAAGLPHHPYGEVYPGHEPQLVSRSTMDGVEVLRGYHLTSPSRSVAMRGAVFVTQALAAATVASLGGPYDVVVVYGPPLVGPLLGRLVATRHRAKLVTVIYDIYPDVAVETGKVSNRAVIEAAKIAERLQYAGSDRIIVLSEGFVRTMVDKGVPREKLRVVPVWLDPDEIRPGERDNAWRAEQGIRLDQTVVLYAGTVGVISNAAVVAEAASRLKDRPDILFLFVGEGEAKAEVERLAEQHGLCNIRLLPFQPRERLAEVQAAADVGLVTLAPGRGRTSVPSKVVAYLAAGRPALASVDSDCDTAHLIESSACGVVAPVGDPIALAAAVAELADDPPRRRELGQRARQAFEAHFSRPTCLERFAEILDEVATP